MFSANENIVLRQHKRRIIGFVEESLKFSDELLDAGTTVLCMQVSCKDPGCVPLETVITICFPSAQHVQQYVPLLEPYCRQNKTTFQTKVFLPMADVTEDDLLDVLPSEGFAGGRFSTQRIIHQARNVVLGYIEQQCSGSAGSIPHQMNVKREMALYLQQELQKYLDNNCVLIKDKNNDADSAIGTATPTEVVIAENEWRTTSASSTATNSLTITATTATTKPSMAGTGNLVIRRILDDEEDLNDQQQQQLDVTNSNRSSSSSSSRRRTSPTSSTSTTATANDWRRYQQNNRRLLSSSTTVMSNNGIQNLQQLEQSQRQHAPGIRQTGCPCCDPDDPSNYVDGMMRL